MNDSSAPVLHTRDERVVNWLTLNRPAAFNTLSAEMLVALQAALDAVIGKSTWQSRPLIRRSPPTRPRFYSICR